MKISDLSFELVDFDCCSSLLLCNGCEETIGDHSEYVGVQFGMCSKGC